jgi:hypothetical protein
MGTKKTLLLAFILVIIGAFYTLGFVLGRGKIPDPVILTDTVYRQKPFTMPRKFPKFQLPGRVIIYPIPSLVELGKLLRINDSLQAVVKDKDTVYVSDKFLLLYPNSPKLLSASFYRDSLSLNLLKPNSQIITQTYSLDYQNKAYQFQDYNLTSKNITLPKPKVEDRHILYLTSSYSYFPEFGHYPNLSLQYSYTRKPFVIQLEPHCTISNKLQFGITTRLGFKLF